MVFQSCENINVQMIIYMCVFVCLCSFVCQQAIATNMGQKKSSLREEGYTIERETESGVIATKDGDRFFIKKIEVSGFITLQTECWQ